MNPVRLFALFPVLLAIGSFLVSNAGAQTSAFTYQGRLNANGTPASGSYDLVFALFDASTNGSPVGTALTNTAVGVSNGVFTAGLDFGANTFPGANRWLEIGVRTNGSVGAFTLLNPRQPITSAPYAIQAASSAQASSVTPGAVTSTGLAAGAAAANLSGGGQSGVASGGIVLSTADNASLVNAGYVRIGTTVLTESWAQRTNGVPPGARGAHTAIWTGTEMIVWGGTSGSGAYNDGGRFNPALNTWTALNTTGAPDARYYHTAVWTGTEMIVWGGFDATLHYLNTGGRYNPASNSWTTVTTSGAPGTRLYHSAVWTGVHMIIWGGGNGTGQYFDGGRYNPAANSWVNISGSTLPGNSARSAHSAVWTGTEMIVWGGYNANAFYNNGFRYTTNDVWTTVNPTGGPTVGRAFHTAVWTGTEMIVWGGKTNQVNNPALADGGRFNPASGGSWTALTTNNAPGPRNSATAVWTGSEMIVWGGITTNITLNTGGRYNPAFNTWTATPAVAAPNVAVPNKRYFQTAVWTGNEMIVWGGLDGVTPLGDTWTYTPPKVMFLYQKP